MSNCSYAGLTSIPKNISSLTTYLILVGNNFITIKNNSFSKLSNLTWLDLSNSQIYHIESDSFLKLQMLKVLSLKDNHLCEKNNSYPEGVFDPVAYQLQVLDISGNLQNVSQENLSYPGKTLNVLHSLAILKLDCISGQRLNEEFQNLTNLKELDFSHGIEAKYLPDDMFDSVSNVAIQIVNFTNVNLMKINGSMFSALKLLEVLDLTNNPQLKNTTVDIARALSHTIQELYLAKTCLGTTGSVPDVIRNLMGKNITVLTLDWNQIHKMGESHIFDRLPNLEILTLTHNNVRDYTGFLYNFTNARHLRKLDSSYQLTYVPSSPCQQDSSIQETNDHPRFESKSNYFFPI